MRSSIISLQASQLVRNLGEDHHPKIQHYLNNTPAKESMDNKAIYQSGCLRKVSKSITKFQGYFLTLMSNK
jgi:hypothetical protein